MPQRPTSSLIFLLALPATLAHGPRDARWQRPPAPAGVVSHGVVYEIDGRPYEGFVAFPDTSTGAIPGLLVAHQWMGLGEMEKFRAEEMAGWGYYAFALDVYGQGVRPNTTDEASAVMTALTSDPPELRKRIYAGLAMIQEGGLDEGPARNESALVANGYCFGGLMILELARTSAPVTAVCGFHAGLANITDTAEDAFGDVAIQLHHAQFDSSGDAGLLGVEAELSAKPVVIFETIKYGNQYHGFTDPTNDVYDARSAEQSHASMRHFYAARLGMPYTC